MNEQFLDLFKSVDRKHSTETKVSSFIAKQQRVPLQTKLTIAIALISCMSLRGTLGGDEWKDLPTGKSLSLVFSSLAHWMWCYEKQAVQAIGAKSVSSSLQGLALSSCHDVLGTGTANSELK